jgi:hypothetical protein
MTGYSQIPAKNSISIDDGWAQQHIDQSGKRVGSSSSTAHNDAYNKGYTQEHINQVDSKLRNIVNSKKPSRPPAKKDACVACDFVKSHWMTIAAGTAAGALAYNYYYPSETKSLEETDHHEPDNDNDADE